MSKSPDPIERLELALRERLPALVPKETGRFVRYTDHLALLTSEQQRREEVEGEKAQLELRLREEQTRRATDGPNLEAAETRLREVEEALEAEIERLEKRHDEKRKSAGIYVRGGQRELANVVANIGAECMTIAHRLRAALATEEGKG